MAALERREQPARLRGIEARAVVAHDVDRGAVVAGGPADDAVPDPMANVEKVEMKATVEHLDDMLTAIGELGRAFDANAPADPLADLQAMLLAQGFAPTFFKNIDIGGLHTMWMAFPAGRDAGPEAIDLAASVSVVDARKVIEGTPASS